MKNVYERTKRLIGQTNLEKLKASKIIVFGVGGVGGYCVEALARAGIGTISLVDFDIIDVTNINRQIIALESTIGREKVGVMAERIRDINRDITVNTFVKRVSEENICDFQLDQYDYAIDAIDDVKGKLAIILNAKNLGVPVISCMGTGNKINGKNFQICNISKTHTCPLAKKIRKELRNLGINDLKVLFSSEEPSRFEEVSEFTSSPGSISFVPSVAGLLMAGEVVRDILTDSLNV